MTTEPRENALGIYDSAEVIQLLRQHALEDGRVFAGIQVLTDKAATAAAIADAFERILASGVVLDHAWQMDGEILGACNSLIEDGDLYNPELAAADKGCSERCGGFFAPNYSELSARVLSQILLQELIFEEIGMMFGAQEVINFDISGTNPNSALALTVECTLVSVSVPLGHDVLRRVSNSQLPIKGAPNTKGGFTVVRSRLELGNGLIFVAETNGPGIITSPVSRILSIPAARRDDVEDATTMTQSGLSAISTQLLNFQPIRESAAPAATASSGKCRPQAGAAPAGKSFGELSTLEHPRLDPGVIASAPPPTTITGTMIGPARVPDIGLLQTVILREATGALATPPLVNGEHPDGFDMTTLVPSLQLDGEPLPPPPYQPPARESIEDLTVCPREMPRLVLSKDEQTLPKKP